MTREALWTLPTRIRWPELGVGAGALKRGLGELERTERLSPEALRAAQLTQLGELLEFAFTKSPFYAERLGAAGYEPGVKLTEEFWRRLPVLSRVEVQARGAELAVTELPADHGGIKEVHSSGSTGRPVRILRTEYCDLLWSLLLLRDHLWHRRDFKKIPAAVRWFPKGGNDYPKGGTMPTWGAPVSALFDSGPSYALSIAASAEEVVEWLNRIQPHYLLLFPSLLPHLIRDARRRRITLARLDQVLTVAEFVSPEVRALCRAEWGAPIKDVYSAHEVGYIALECPDQEHYHVQAETIHVEVLNERHEPCAPGEIGEVVVTPLHNFVMPLIRYAIGDLAEVGSPCPCGRGLPVLRRILGRTRNAITLMNGRRVMPGIGELRYAEAIPVTQYQIIQKAWDRLEARLVATRRGTPEEEERLRAIIRGATGSPFRIDILYVDAIARGPGGKFEEFKSEI